MNIQEQINNTKSTLENSKKEIAKLEKELEKLMFLDTKNIWTEQDIIDGYYGLSEGLIVLPVKDAISDKYILCGNEGRVTQKYTDNPRTLDQMLSYLNNEFPKAGKVVLQPFTK
jgi:septal ring factor EnvC (AmiA/AmiB activator)